MEEDKVSRMALIMAYCRGYHATYETPKVFNDFLAYDLLGEEKRAYFDKLFIPPIQVIESFDPAFAATNPDQASIMAWVMQFTPIALAISRAQYTEDSLEQAIKRGVSQYVILGAGLDTFAFRRPDLVEQLQVFELDHPATQAYKRRRLVELDWKLPKNLHFIPIDFTQKNLATELASSAFDTQSLSFFSWLGVTFYLTRDEIFDMLRSIAEVASAGSSIIFDYFDSDVFIPGKASPLMQKSLEDARQHGEPVKTGFNPSMLSAELASLGLNLQEDLSPHDIDKRFFEGRTDTYHAYELMHFASVVVK